MCQINIQINCIGSYVHCKINTIIQSVSENNKLYLTFITDLQYIFLVSHFAAIFILTINSSLYPILFSK